MKSFLIKASLIILLPIIASIILLFFIPKIITPLNKTPSDFIKSFEKSKIIIAGDSRADRQINPSILKNTTKCNTLNISMSMWDLYSLSKTLKKANISNKVIVISASFFQINDGSISNGYFNLEAFCDLNFREKLVLYKNRIDILLLQQFRLVKNSLTDYYSIYNLGNYQRVMNLEFNEQPCNVYKMDENWFDKNPLYESPKIDGIKKKLLVKSLDNLQKLKNCKILIYNGPVSNEFIKYGEKKGILKFENKYNDFMSSECKKKGIAFHSFLGDTSLINSNLYYDPQHLCKNGVPIFSYKIAEMLFELNYVK